VSKHDRFLRRAEAVAIDSSHPRWKLGVVVVRGSRIVASANNIQKNAPHILEGGPGTSVHAEINALRKLTYQADRAEGCTLYVVRVSRQGSRRLARPCLRCYKSIASAGIRSIVYSLDTEEFGWERIGV
jgi:deoxycytidylate deaminase